MLAGLGALGVEIALKGVPLVLKGVPLAAVGLGKAGGFLALLLALELQCCCQLVALPLQPHQFLLPLFLLPLMLVLALDQVFQLLVEPVELLLQAFPLLAGVGQFPGQSVVFQGRQQQIGRRGQTQPFEVVAVGGGPAQISAQFEVEVGIQHRRFLPQPGLGDEGAKGLRGRQCRCIGGGESRQGSASQRWPGLGRQALQPLEMAQLTSSRQLE